MPITLVRSENTHCLWNHCKNSFLDQIGTKTGPGNYPSFLWVTNRNIRDSFLECAQARGLKGWLGPPFKIWSELPESFGIREKPIGLLTRQILIGQIAQKTAEETGLDSFKRQINTALPGQMIDRLLADFLPEGITPKTLETGLSTLSVDDFGSKRNRWITETYRTYLRELEQKGLRDIRSLNSLIAEKIDAGGLPGAINNAKTLHLYGVATTKGRKRLLESLSNHSDVETIIYLPKEEEASEWERLAKETLYIADSQTVIPEVQAATDSSIEAQSVAARIKKILVTQEIDPHEIAVISRTPEKDSSQVAAELESSGIPITRRIQIPILECGVISALLDIYKAAAKGWNYRVLKRVLSNPYLKTGIAPHLIDRLPMKQSFMGLPDWKTGIQNHKFEPRDIDSIKNFKNFANLMEPLTKSHTLSVWIKLSLEMLSSDPFEMKLQASEPVGEDWNIVRIDQRAVVQLESILREWLELDDSKNLVQPNEWNSLVWQVLNTQYLSLETPLKKGVQVLGATEAILSNFKYTFIINANHEVFPKAFHSSGILSNQERNLLAKLNIPIPNHTSEQRHERSIWRSIAQQPQVTISYRTANFDGEISEPSVMVPQHTYSPITKSTLKIETNPTALLIESAKQLAASGNPESLLPVRTPHPEILKHAILAAHAESKRPGNKTVQEDSGWLHPNPWNGEIRDAVVKEYLGKYFGPDYVWTPGNLENYSILPFNFWMTKVLRIERSGKVEDETSPLISGSLAHKILEQFYSTTQNNLPTKLEGEAEQFLKDITKAAVKELEECGKWLGEPVLWKQECEKIVSEVQDYLTFELPSLEEQGHTPFLVEWKFGYEDPRGLKISGKDINNQEKSLRIRGIIDRVDHCGTSDPLNDGKDTYSILDYKRTKTPSKGGYDDGSVLQAPIYLLALRQAGYNLDRARYRSIRNPKTPKGKAKEAALMKADSEKLEAVLRIAFSIPDRIRSGKFEPVISRKTASWRASDPGIEISRSLASITKGSRFDG